MRALLAKCTGQEDLTERSSSASERIYSEVKISSGSISPDGTSKRSVKDCHVIRHLVNTNNGWKDGEILYIWITNYRGKDGGEGHAEVYITGTAFTQLGQVFKDGYKLKVFAKHMKSEETILTADMEVYPAEDDDEFTECLEGESTCEDIEPTMSGKTFFSKVKPEDVMICVIISSTIVSISEDPFYDMKGVVEKMLKEKIGVDTTLLSQDGLWSVMCHKGFLAAQSPVFSSMLTIPMEEGRTGVINTELGEYSLMSFLAFLYTREIVFPLHEPQIAMELLEAGHKYDIEVMERTLKRILLDMPDTMFTVDQAIRLFFFVRNVVGMEDLKMKAINILAKNKDELEGSPEYKRLFFINSPGEEARAARELLTEVISTLSFSTQHATTS